MIGNIPAAQAAVTAVFVSIRRQNGQVLIPHGDTVILPRSILFNNFDKIPILDYIAYVIFCIKAEGVPWRYNWRGYIRPSPIRCGCKSYTSLERVRPVSVT
jgi:hypothetical protein